MINPLTQVAHSSPSLACVGWQLHLEDDSANWNTPVEAVTFPIVPWDSCRHTCLAIRHSDLMFIFRVEQVVPQRLEEVFEFFSRAENLEELTPPWLHFRILKVEPSLMREGTKIDYRLRWRAMPIRWTTEILQWEPPRRFVDVQREGPYKVWHHQHRFEEVSGGTRIEDEVEYELPLGVIGRAVHAVIVRRDIEAIFEFRRRVVEERFGKI